MVVNSIGMPFRSATSDLDPVTLSLVFTRLRSALKSVELEFLSALTLDLESVW